MDFEKSKFISQIKLMQTEAPFLAKGDSYSVCDTWMGLSAVKNLQSSESAWLEKTCVPNLGKE
jgi:hypothetical protein